MAGLMNANIHVIYLICKYMACIFCFFQRELSKKTSASEKGKIILGSIRHVINGHFPELFEKFNQLTDSRKKREYAMSEIIAGALFMFIFKETSRNAYNNDRREDKLREAVYKYFGIRLPQADASDDVLCLLPPGHLEDLKAQLVSGLIEQKILRKFRFLGKYYLVAVDGTGMSCFEHKHCEHCLTRTSKNGVVTYFHYVLEAKLITSSGLCISLASEFIENQPAGGYEKQDCEQKAFVRLAAKMKKKFPRLPVCILADGLYPNNTVFEICRKYRWMFIITLKDGCLKTFNKEVALLEGTAKKCSVYRADKCTRTTLDYAFLNDIEYGKHTYSWVSCKQTVVHIKDNQTETTHFVYISNIRQNADNVVITADSGRLRWKIENEGFNTQKNLGYELEHKFSRKSYTAMQNYYQLLQIAHMINQFAERTKAFIGVLHEYSKQTIVALWKELMGFMKHCTCEQSTNTEVCPTD
jgi:hypothetical protein